MRAATFSLSKSGARRAFTLLELLISLAIFCLIFLFLISITSNTALVTNSFQTKIERNTELRRALDCLSADFRNSVLRDDLVPVFVKSPGNDEIYFHSAVDGHGGERGVTFIGYRIRNGHLERGAQGTDWASNAIPFSTNLGSSDFIVNQKNIAYDVLGERIFRMETDYLMKNGAWTTDLSSASWKDVTAIAINLATIDQRSLKKSTATLEEFAALFPDAQSGNPVIKTWSQRLMDPTFVAGDASLPAEARKGIQIRQRIFPISNE